MDRRAMLRMDMGFYCVMASTEAPIWDPCPFGLAEMLVIQSRNQPQEYGVMLLMIEILHDPVHIILLQFLGFWFFKILQDLYRQQQQIASGNLSLVT